MDSQGRYFNFWRALRLGSFHIGSAMGDILVTSLWNRIMIFNFGIPATPVGLLIALRYLLSPLSLWAGNRTDNRLIMGLRRTPVIWLGRGMMVLSLPLLGLSVMRLGDLTTDPLGWVFALLSSLMYGVGTLISGSPFLALVRESAPEEKQGLAISSVETILIIFFAITGVVFSIWMPVFSEAIFWQIILVTMGIGAFFWFFAIAGVERRLPQATQVAPTPTPHGHQLSEVLRGIWRDRRTKLFFAFLSLATFSAWAKDAVLEPFGGEVFGLSIGTTTRFNSYWQFATVLTLVGSGFLLRKRRPELQGRVAGGGLVVMSLGMLLLALTSYLGVRQMVEFSLVIFGAGFGVYTFGGLSLLAVMSPDRHSGAYLGLWTISILLFKGLGTFFGGAVRDLLLLQMGLSPEITYGTGFLLQAIGLAAAVVILSRIDIVAFARETGRHVSVTDAQIAAAD
jgi:MFS transporter, BCD family, chlorophyll transporter